MTGSMPDDCQTMAATFLAHGGLASCDALVECLRDVEAQPLSRVARWIAAQDIVTLRWQHSTWVPLFQFTSRFWLVRPLVSCVIEELRETLDAQQLAAWFATPNDWLNGRRPLACVDGNARELLQAARADRFVARG